jgi:hypothetical protein
MAGFTLIGPVAPDAALARVPEVYASLVAPSDLGRGPVWLVVFEGAASSAPVVRTSHSRKICRRLGQQVSSAIVLCRSITEEARAVGRRG